MPHTDQEQTGASASVDIATKARTERSRLDFLDGVRALAALFVMMHHARTTTNGAWLPGLKGLASDWMFYGHLAVDVFIVLSGFCLILPVAKRGTLQGGAWAFYLRRAWRILPPFYACLVFALLVIGACHALPQMYYTAPLKFLLVNAFLLQDLFPKFNTLDTPLWSVAVEWKIYFLFPLLALLWTRPRFAGVPGPIAVLSLTALISYSLTELIHWWRPEMELDHTCPWYVFLFGMGLCAGGSSVRDTEKAEAPWWRDQWVFATVVMSIIVAVLLALKAPLSLPLTPAVDTCVGTLTALALFLCSRASRRGRRTAAVTSLSWRPLVFIGTFAYSIYLIHSVLMFALEVNIMPLHLSDNRKFAVVCLALPVMIALSYLYFLVCERPFLVRRHKETLAQVAQEAALSPAP